MGVIRIIITAGVALLMLSGCAAEPARPTVDMSVEEVRELVERSYQYVALYNVISKFAASGSYSDDAGGWNRIVVNDRLLDHTVQSIARPNNDTLYTTALLDLRKDPVVLSVPAFDSAYASMEPCGYDHYVQVVMSSRLGDFRRAERVLFYSARTEGYGGEPVATVDRIVETSCDFVEATIRVMPHLSDSDRFERILQQLRSVELETLEELRGRPAKDISDVEFPSHGATDADTFGSNLLEVMQFVFNHTTFDPGNALDRKLLALYEPLGVVPGRAFDETGVADLDSALLRRVAEDVAAAQRAKLADPSARSIAEEIFRPKGETSLEALLRTSVLGPLGLPMEEAVYRPIGTVDGAPMNALHDYVVRMSRQELPPAEAFWSLTLYDRERGFFIPNEQKKYSVGENAGFELDSSGGIEIHVAAERPDAVPDENWLPIQRRDQEIDLMLRIYQPDIERLRTWNPPLAERAD